MTNLTPRHGRTLLALARTAIAAAVGRPAASVADGGEPWLSEPGAVFVTLTQDGELRGCIGSLEPRRTLKDDVEANAVSAALRDPRFPPLQASELDRTLVEVSVLTQAVPLDAATEDEALACLRPRVDGVILAAGPYRSTFLPQVWEDLPDPAQFLAHLKRKAGLPARGWMPGTRLSTYQVTKFAEGATEVA